MFTRTLALGLAASALAACSSVRVATDRDASADFSRLHAFAFLPRNDAADPIADNGIVRKRIAAAISRELAAKGYAAADAGKADFLVGFETAERERIDVTTWPSWCTRGFGRRRFGPYWGWHDDVTVTQYTQGALVVGVLDPKSNELLWRGTATSVVDDDSGDEEHVREAVTKLLADFPYPKP
jgi:hypothetical protein